MTTFTPDDLLETLAPSQETEVPTTDSPSFTPEDLLATVSSPAEEVVPEKTEQVKPPMQPLKGEKKEYLHAKYETPKPGFELVQAPDIMKALEGGTAFRNTMIPDRLLQRISSQYDVPLSKVRFMADVYGGMRELGEDELSAIDFVKSTAASAAQVPDAMVANSLSWLYKKMQTPKGEEALDTVRHIVERTRSYATAFAPSLAPMAGVAKLAQGTTLLAKSAGSAAIGAVGSLTRSDYGDELKDLGIGAAFGAALPVAGKGLAKIPAATSWLVDKLPSGALKTDTKIAKLFNEAKERIINEHMDSDNNYLEAMKKAIKDPELAESPFAAKEFGIEGIAESFYGSKYDSFRKKALKDRNYQALGINQKNADAFLDSQVMQSQMKRLASYMSPNAKPKTMEAVSEIINGGPHGGGFGYEDMFDFLKKARVQDHEKKAIASIMDEVENLKGIGNLPPNFFGKIADKLSDTTFVASGADRRYGLGLEPTMNKIYKGITAASNDTFKYSRYVDGISKDASKAGLSNDIIFKFMDEGESAIKGLNLNQEQTEILKYYDDLRTAMRDRLIDLGEPVGNLKNWIRHQVVGAPEYVRIMRKEATEIKPLLESMGTNGPASLLRRDVSEMSANELRIRNFLVSLQYSAPDPIMKKGDLARAMAMLDDPASMANALQTRMKSALKREGEIPSLILERDVDKILLGYAAQSLKHAHTREALRELEMKIPSLRQLGDTATATHFEKLLGDIVNSRSGPVTDFVDKLAIGYTTSMQKWADDLAAKGNNAGSKLVDGLSLAPKMFQFMQEQMYPNLIGFNVKSIAKNIVTPFTQSALEVGEGGEKAMFIGLARTARKVREKGIMGLREELAAKNIVPAEFISSELTHAQRESAGKTSEFVGETARGLRTLNKVAMFGFESAETANRSVVQEASNYIAEQYMAGKGYKKFVEQKLGEGWKDAAQKAKEAGNAEELTKVLSAYLQNRTMFQYNQASASSYRRTVGPILGAFTKFPSAAIGDITDKIRQDGIVRGSAKAAGKWLGPWVVLNQINNMLDWGDEKPEGRIGLLVGKSGATEYGPQDALNGYLGLPPAISALGGLAGIVGGMYKSYKDEESFLDWLESEASPRTLRALDNTFNMFLPGASLYKFMLQDVPHALTGERPEDIYSPFKPSTYEEGELPKLPSLEKMRQSLPDLSGIDEKMGDKEAALPIAVAGAIAGKRVLSIPFVEKLEEKALAKIVPFLEENAPKERLIHYAEKAISWAKRQPLKELKKPEDAMKQLPGTAVKPTKKEGMETWDWYVWGRKMGSTMSEEGARSKILEYAQRLKRLAEGVYER